MRHIAFAGVAAALGLVGSVGCLQNIFDPWDCAGGGTREFVAADRALADAQVGVAYDESFGIGNDALDTINGLNDVYLADGESLPAGLAIEFIDGDSVVADEHRLRGTPTEVGSFSFRLIAQGNGTQCGGPSDDLVVELDVRE